MPEEEMMSSEARQYLDQAVDQLPDSLKVVFLLRDIEGLSTAETGEVLNLSETAVKTRLSRARLRLRELLSTYYREQMEQKQARQEQPASQAAPQGRAAPKVRAEGDRS